jgi:hypothetical protein
MFKSLSTANEKALARQLAEGVGREIPPSVMVDRSKTLSVNKITRLLERSFEQAAAYQREHRLGFYKRAVLANSLKWELKDAGYPDDFVDIAVEGLVVALSKATRTAAPGSAP